MGGPAAGAPGDGGWVTTVKPELTDAQKWARMNDAAQAFGKMTPPAADMNGSPASAATPAASPPAPSGPIAGKPRWQAKQPQMSPLPTLSGFLQGY